VRQSNVITKNTNIIIMEKRIELERRGKEPSQVSKAKNVVQIFFGRELLNWLPREKRVATTKHEMIAVLLFSNVDNFVAFLKTFNVFN
jgi:hypothetical protein